MQKAFFIPTQLVSRSILRKSLQQAKCLNDAGNFLRRAAADEDNDKNNKAAHMNANLKIDGTLLQSLDPSKDNSLNKLSALDTKETNFSMDEMILKSSTNEGEFSGEEESLSDDDISAQILNVALEFVPKYGWSDRAIEEAVRTLELSPSSAGMFKRGAIDLVIHFIEKCNKELSVYLADLQQNKTYGQNKSAFIEHAVQTRLKMIIPYIDSWPQALILLASPAAAADCLENGANMVDDIWYHAGDISVDMSWYSKRAALAVIYVVTELYMLRDNSIEFKNTWDFLHQRLEDLKAAQITKNSISHTLNGFCALAGAGFSIAQNILGMNSKNR